MFIPIFNEFLRTDKVPKFPTLIVSMAIAGMSLSSFVCGLILHTIRKYSNQFFELALNQINKNRNVM